jgi:N-acetylglucosamine-6-sulfatase
VGTLLVLAAGGCGGSHGGTVPQGTVPKSQPGSIAPTSTGTVPPSGRPNVVVVMTDDQRTDDTSVMRTVESKLAAKGVTFTRNFATYPLCCPSRTTFLTGEYAHNHRVQSNNPPGGGYAGFMRKVPPGRTLGVRLQRAGYRTGYVGKFLNEFAPDSENPEPPGWDVFDGLIGVTEYMMYGYSIDQDGTTKRYGSAPADYQTDVLAGLASKFLRTSARRPRPFFLTFAPVAPHDDVVPRGARNPEPAPRDTRAFANRPPPHGPSFNRQITGEPHYLQQPPLSPAEIRSETAIYRDRLASLLAVDDAVARMIRVLRATGELRDTYFIFTSDNGYLLGEHRRTGKELPYEESVKVPLIIRGPGIEQGLRRSQLVGNIDLAPTILDIAGLPWRQGTDGISLLGPAASPQRDDSRPMLFERAQSEGTPYGAARTDRYAYIAYGAPGRHGPRELFDLQRDPYENHNVYRSPAYADALRALQRLLARLRTCHGSSCRAPSAPIPGPSA